MFKLISSQSVADRPYLSEAVIQVFGNDPELLGAIKNSVPSLEMLSRHILENQVQEITLEIKISGMRGDVAALHSHIIEAAKETIVQVQLDSAADNDYKVLTTKEGVLTYMAPPAGSGLPVVRPPKIIRRVEEINDYVVTEE